MAVFRLLTAANYMTTNNKIAGSLGDVLMTAGFYFATIM